MPACVRTGSGRAQEDASPPGPRAARPDLCVSAPAPRRRAPNAAARHGLPFPVQRSRRGWSGATEPLSPALGLSPPPSQATPTDTDLFRPVRMIGARRAVVDSGWMAPAADDPQGGAPCPACLVVVPLLFVAAVPT